MTQAEMEAKLVEALPCLGRYGFCQKDVLVSEEIERGHHRFCPAYHRPAVRDLFVEVAYEQRQRSPHIWPEDRRVMAGNSICKNPEFCRTMGGRCAPLVTGGE